MNFLKTKIHTILYKKKTNKTTTDVVTKIHANSNVPIQWKTKFNRHK